MTAKNTTALTVASTAGSPNNLPILGIAEIDYGTLFGSFIATASTPDPLTNLKCTYDDASTTTYVFNSGEFVAADIASGVNYITHSVAESDTIDIYLSDITKLTAITIAGSAYTGSVPVTSSAILLEQFNLANNQLTGTLQSISLNTALLGYYCQNNSISGSIPDLSNNTLLITFNCSGNSLTGFSGGWPNKAFTFNASNNALTESAVNQILIDADTYGIASGTTIDLSGGTNAAPTGAGATAKANLISGGATVTTN